MNATNISLRIKCNGQDQDVEVPSNVKIFDVKCQLLRSWPLKWPRARVPTDLRFIFLGKELLDDEVVSDICQRCTSGVMTMHLVIRERNIASPGNTPKVTPTVHYSGSPVKVRQGPLIPDRSLETASNNASDSNSDSDSGAAHSNEDEEHQEEAAAHFHAVTVSERELMEFRMIFDRKKGPDGRVAIEQARAVLQSYWKFIHREGFEATPRPFPAHRLDELCRKINATSGLTLDQFLVVFYLFDNAAAEEPCIHGERERVRVACSQLHSVLAPSHDFYHERYEEIFALVCGDENQAQLTCKEMELLYYMYSCYALERVREEELVAKVQAIVRMRIQASKYTKMVDAARRVQNAWRLRMFTSDRHNHERISDFLKTLLHGPDKIGGPRF